MGCPPWYCVVLSVVDIDESNSAPLCSIMHSISSVTNKQTMLVNCDAATILVTSEWHSMQRGDIFPFFRIWTHDLSKYSNFLPNDWGEFKLGRQTHGLSLNLTGWYYFKSQRCTSRGVYMLATLRLYQRRQNGVLCTEGISLQVAIRASTKVEKRFFPLRLATSNIYHSERKKNPVNFLT